MTTINNILVEMSITMTVFFIFSILFAIYMSIRNCIVISVRTKFLFNNFGAYKNLPSYHRMWWQLTKFNWDEYYDNNSK